MKKAFVADVSRTNAENDEGKQNSKTHRAINWRWQHVAENKDNVEQKSIRYMRSCHKLGLGLTN